MTLPKALRESLSIEAGDYLEIDFGTGGEAALRKLEAPGSSSGILKHLAKAKPVSVEEMDAAVQDAVSEKYRPGQ